MSRHGFRPIDVFNALGIRNYLNWMPDIMYLKIQYRLALHKKLNLDTPVTFNEKIQWLKLYDRKPEYTMMVDKYAVRKFIADTIGEAYSIPLVGGPWNSFDEIDFEKLPNQFVLKCNHDSGGLVICKDKTRFDKNAACKKIRKSLRRNFYWANREWPYKNVKPCIIAEQYMVDDSGYELRDYKFFCFDGIPKVMFIATDRSGHNSTKFDFFDMDFNHLPLTNGHPCADKTPEKPKCFDEMIRLARILSKGIKQVRVDFYEISGKVYFGEMTFSHWGGKVPFKPEEWDYKFGEWIKIER